MTLGTTEKADGSGPPPRSISFHIDRLHPKPTLSPLQKEPHAPSPIGIDRNLTHYADPGFRRYLRRAFLSSAGYDEADSERPIVGIADTSSDYTTCHRAIPNS